MAWTTVLAVYFVVWWIVLFAVLPWGIRSQAETGDFVAGTDPGAPALPQLLWKVIWTTAISAGVTASFYVIYVYRLVTVDELASWLGMPKLRP